MDQGAPLPVYGRTIRWEDPTTHQPVYGDKSVGINYYAWYQPGTYEISVTATAGMYGFVNGQMGPVDVTLTDSLTVVVEAPTVNWFRVGGADNDQAQADPLWFGTTSGSPASPDPSGTRLSFFLADDQPPLLQPRRDDIAFWSSVTNNSHYAVEIGFIQEIDIDARADYTNGLFHNVQGTDGLDRVDGTQNFFLQDRSVKIDPGAAMTFSSPTIKVTDSPEVTTTAGAKNSLDVQGWLTSMSMSYQFRTNLAIVNGFRRENGQYFAMGSIPVALSTAKWYMTGSAGNPTAADLASTINPANWTVSLSAGPGTTPAVGPPRPNVKWISNGDGQIKFIDWTFLAGRRLLDWSIWRGPLAPVASAAPGDATAVGEAPRPDDPTEDVVDDSMVVAEESVTGDAGSEFIIDDEIVDPPGTTY